MTMPSRLSRSPFSTALRSDQYFCHACQSFYVAGFGTGGLLSILTIGAVLDRPDHLVRTRDDLVALGQSGENFNIRSSADARFHLAKLRLCSPP